jgi:hypothetical protein
MQEDWSRAFRTRHWNIPLPVLHYGVKKPGSNDIGQVFDAVPWRLYGERTKIFPLQSALELT